MFQSFGNTIRGVVELRRDAPKSSFGSSGPYWAHGQLLVLDLRLPPPRVTSEPCHKRGGQKIKGDGEIERERDTHTHTHIPRKRGLTKTRSRDTDKEKREEEREREREIKITKEETDTNIAEKEKERAKQKRQRERERERDGDGEGDGMPDASSSGFVNSRSSHAPHGKLTPVQGIAHGPLVWALTFFKGP